MDEPVNVIDRIAPASRPWGNADGTQTWKSLLFMHWEVPAETLRNCVPSGLEIDTYEGRGFVGVVPFKMRDIRPRWLPRRLAFNFLETNVRTYVIAGGRPGVYFFSLDADSRLAVLAARIGWSLPYRYAAMKTWEDTSTRSYHSQRRGCGSEHRVTFRVNQELGPSQPGTIEHFLLERYLMFVPRNRRIYVGQVHHVPYHAYTAEVVDVTDGLVAAAGLPAVNRPPDLAHYCDGVDVDVYGIRRM